MTDKSADIMDLSLLESPRTKRSRAQAELNNNDDKATKHLRRARDELYLYDSNNKGPFLVYIDLIDESPQGEKKKPLNQIRLGSILNSIGAKDINAIKKIGYRRCKIIFTNFRSANWIATNEHLKKHHLVAKILPSFLMKFGLVFGVPIEYTEEELLKMVDQHPDYPVKSVERIFRKDRETNKLIATMRIKIGFKSSHVPEEVKLGYAIMECRYYIPNIRQCFRCQIFGHQAEHCKSQQICINCGVPHSKNECNSNFKCCANCGGSHAANDRNCVMRDRYMKIHKIMILENLNFKEAEKKLTIPEFKYFTSDFPSLSNNKVTPTVQEQVNNIITSSYPMSSLLQTRRNTPKKSNAKPYKPPPVGTDIFKDLASRGPVFEHQAYLLNKVTEYEKVLSEIANKLKQIPNGEEANQGTALIEEISALARTATSNTSMENTPTGNILLDVTC